MANSNVAQCVAGFYKNLWPPLDSGLPLEETRGYVNCSFTATSTLRVFKCELILQEAEDVRSRDYAQQPHRASH
jgi:hypothetical protein